MSFHCAECSLSTACWTQNEKLGRYLLVWYQRNLEGEGDCIRFLGFSLYQTIIRVTFFLNVPHEGILLDLEQYGQNWMFLTTNPIYCPGDRFYACLGKTWFSKHRARRLLENVQFLLAFNIAIARCSKEKKNKDT